MFVHVLDVGQGDSVLIETPDGDTILIDAGTAGAQVYDQLDRLGVEDLELVITTHPHADHMGGMRQVLQRYPVELYLDSGMEHTTKSYKSLMGMVDKEEVNHRPAKKGETFEFDDGIVLTVLWPGTSYLRGTRSDLNSNSVVVRVDHFDNCFLFTGDAEEPTERALLSGGLETCEVLKVAHHGSNHSTSTSFLRAVDPDIALISAGANNRYGHPGEETVQRLQSQDVVIYRTDDSGHLTVASNRRGVEVVDGLPWTDGRGPTAPNSNKSDKSGHGSHGGHDGDSHGEPSRPATVDTGEVPDLSGVRGTPPDMDATPPKRGCLWFRQR